MTSSNEQLLIDELHKKHKNNLASVKEISYNDSDKRNFIEIDFKALHLDKIPVKIVRDNYTMQGSSSVDTIIYDSSKNTLYLIEFKEHFPKKKKGEKTNGSLRLKCYDTLAKLCFFWTNELKYYREDFFKLKFKYCLITRNSNTHPSFLNSLNSSNQAFKLKLLEGTFVDETRIIVKPSDIHKLLSRITSVPDMVYHNSDKTTKQFH